MTSGSGSSAVRRPVRRRIVTVLSALALAAAAGVVVVDATRGDEAVGLAATADVTASSTVLGSSPRSVVSTDSSAPVPGWESDRQTVGAWIQLRWPTPHEVHDIVLTRDLSTRTGIRAGVLSFGDSSLVQTQLDAERASTTVSFRPRVVDRVRFTVTAVDPGATGVTITQVAVNAGGARVSDVTADVAATARVTTSGGTVRGGTSGDGSPSAALGWSTSSTPGGWLDLRWSTPQELTAVSLQATPGSAATIRRATLDFSDGAQLGVGAVPGDSLRPTTVAFAPRVVTGLRLRLDAVAGTGSLDLRQLAVLTRGQPSYVSSERSSAAPRRLPATASCGSATGGRPGVALLQVLCPQSGAAVGDQARVVLAVAPAVRRVTAVAWSASGGTGPGTEVDVQGSTAVLTVDLRGLPSGPLTITLHAVRSAGSDPATYLQVFRDAGASVPARPVSAAHTAARTLTYDEEFDRPVVLSRSGADAHYAAAKPTFSGPEDFGAAIFADPRTSPDSVAVLDNRYLRIAVRPTAADETDPRGWQRKAVGGLVASARSGGSGFSAQYGYFEARMAAPAGIGTWPAFWLLSGPNLVAARSAVAEVDAVELYGHEPTGACQSTHDYRDGKDFGKGACGRRFDDVRRALQWHVYGVSVEPGSVRFFVDGVQVASAPQVAAGGEPMFWLVDLALGGGWPIDLAATGGRAELYVDYVRVFV